MKTKIYIAGKITGLEYKSAFKNFENAEVHLQKQGYTNTVNPTKLVAEGTEWEEAMSVCLEALRDCKTIYMLSNWECSKGARIERANAIGLGLEIIYEKD